MALMDERFEGGQDFYHGATLVYEFALAMGSPKPLSRLDRTSNRNHSCVGCWVWLKADPEQIVLQGIERCHIRECHTARSRTLVVIQFEQLQDPESETDLWSHDHDQHGTVSVAKSYALAFAFWFETRIKS